jgi:GDP-D-mannose dehydratase
VHDTGGVRKALITGASGQDRIYLSELLLRKGYHVVGTTRRPLEEVPEAGANSRIVWIQCNPADQAAIEQTLADLQPDECYNRAAQASGSAMYEEPASIDEVGDLCKVAFDRVGLDYRSFVIQDPALCRATEPVPLVGCADKARRVLGRAPTVDFNEFVGMMVDCDLARLHDAVSMNGAES